MSEFGFTNKADEIERVRRFRDAAVADGWDIAPTYENHEPAESAAKLHKVGFTMMVLSRDRREKKDDSKWDYEAQVSLWGPDGLAIKAPAEYDWRLIQDGVHVCSNCGTSAEKTVQYSFAGRCCEACLPEMKKKHEYPGWCD